MIIPRHSITAAIRIPVISYRYISHAEVLQSQLQCVGGVSVHGVLLFSGCLALRHAAECLSWGAEIPVLHLASSASGFSLSCFKLGLSEDVAHSVCIGARSVHHVAATPTTAELDT
jgi:hypothetical protein